jgi:hypothetical protein
MRVVVTPEAQAFIAAAGGTAYVTPLQRRCCGGALTVLAATTTSPEDAASYEPVGDALLGVRYRRRRRTTEASVAPAGIAEQPVASSSTAEAGEAPLELLIELRGHRRPRLVACWDGCAYKI